MQETARETRASSEFKFPAGLEEARERIYASRRLVAENCDLPQYRQFLEENKLNKSATNVCTLRNGEIWIDQDYRLGAFETPVHSGCVGSFIVQFTNWESRLPHLAPNVSLYFDQNVHAIHEDSNSSRPDVTLVWRLPGGIKRFIPVEISYGVGLEATHARMNELLHYPFVAAGIIVSIKYPISVTNRQYDPAGGSYVFIYYERPPNPETEATATRVISFGNRINHHDKVRILEMVHAPQLLEMEGNCYPGNFECNAASIDDPVFAHHIPNELAFSLNGHGTILNGVMNLTEIQQEHHLTFSMFALQQRIARGLETMNESNEVLPDVDPRW